MELHPILEADDVPNYDMWYVLSPRGEPPSMRVGHTCIFVPENKESSSKLLIVGGANPNGSFSETYFLDFKKYEWDIPELKGLQARYEHTTWLTDNNVYVFGGADMNGNLNTIQKLDLDTDLWTTPVLSGIPPSPRTCHAHATANNMMYVIGGGETGAEPVADRQLHVFDSKTLTWSQPKTNGKPPKARHGHVMVVIGNKLFLHGGMSRNTFFDDLHELNLKTLTWKQVRCKGDIPSGRAAHAAVSYGNHIIISCGMNHTGAMDDLYHYNTDTSRWTKLNIEGAPPSCRLDHSMCIIEWKYKQKKEKANSEHSIMNQVNSDCATNTPQIQKLTLSDDRIKVEDGTVDQVSCANSVTESDTEDVLPQENASTGASADVASFSPPGAAAANEIDVTEQTIEGCEIVSNTKASSLDGSCMMLLMCGGMDTQGEIFDDTLVLRLNLPT
ncbi:uncharacterized protein [Antedon mediterranea]|uniref:uncharacterized protein n=1 Tax=Antedon mediterranea TaxID=105859 RepID=UPI003AF422B0